jgi:endogenous inhibitor of DNA gyrase (YacG/DUF329 family)
LRKCFRKREHPGVIARRLAEAAVDCARCRRLVAEGTDPLAFAPPRTVDLGAAAGYAPSRIFGVSDAPSMRCPDCGREVRHEEYRGAVFVRLDLDRPPG